ncbi:lipopolysaccharide biosynthesis protein [Melioribacter roseus P3M-2]|uniref:Lipopolysaccharide biosynthesis protein n=1 Tax=Melioribacter roseus (strain DSM 23840 / JCM 17771 / VKM B-2668 / P3M-2) TaxID=1191523 RepID=I6ZWW1_MELRP|nr:Wzz/FepE/Etk N-terminal domain-containing protein [Melioribacter roseus]AFN73548.1 lipopolysaccharide biosynthesis protein [Melioribacter roseus P3M-2]
MNQENQPTEQKTEVVGATFIEFLTVLVKYRKFLFWFVFTITVGATVYALLAPKWYKSTASVLAADRNDLLSTLSGLSSLAKGFSASKGLAALTGGNTETDRYIAILKSATLTDDIIKKFKLREEYDMEDDYYEKVVKEWQSNLDLEIQDEGNLTITVYDKDPQKAADIANYMVEKLNEINTQLSVTNAKANREFIEKRYLQNLEDIKNLETEMQKFQEKYGVIAVPEQLEATVKSMSSIYLDMYRKEVEYNVVKQMYGVDHPLAHTTQIELNELKKKIDLLNTGKDESQQDVKLLIPFKEAPELGNEYLKIYRNLEIQYKILEFIQPLYEQAKVEEVRNTPSVLVLDKAGPADRKAKPKGSIYAAVSFVSSLMLGLFIVFLIEFFAKMKIYAPQKYDFIRAAISADLGMIMKNRKKNA